MQFRASLSVLYFVTGFFLAAVTTMVLLVLVRPYLDTDQSESVRTLAMYAPLIIAIPYGLRVAYLGMRDDIKLGSALKRGLFL
jgi:uncharacterized membrane protein